MSFLVSTGRCPPHKKKRFDDEKHRSYNNKYEDVIVVGYHSKLFRDDAMAQYIEDGKHLIPWMGDESLLIDRYDCRGHLYSRDEFDWQSSQFSVKLSPEEEQIEQACNAERYLGIHKSVEEENFLEEEEEKRMKLHADQESAGYRNVAFSYESASNDGSKEYDPNDCFEEDSDEENGLEANIIKISKAHSDRKKASSGAKPFQSITKPALEESVGVYTKPADLEIPSGVDVPDSQKSHSIIEKTALFISKQGTQMEIVLKAKQAGNPQFDFLNFGNWLNPYYKLLLQKIKDGSYIVESNTVHVGSSNDKIEKDSSGSESDGESSDEGEYIHPLLQAHLRPVKTAAEPSQSQQTVSESQQRTVSHAPAPSYEITGSQTALPQSSYADAVAVYMARKYRNSRHDTPSPKAANGGNEDQEQPDEHWADDLEEDQSNALINAQNLAYFNQMQLELANLHPAYMMSSLVPPPPPPGQEDEPGTADPSLYGIHLHPPPPPPGCSEIDLDGRPFVDHQQRQQQQQHIVPPPPDLKQVVDKLADYVSRNGETFEEQVKKKKDPRFDFLKSDNIYYPYYLYKKQHCILEVSMSKAQEKKEQEEKVTKPLSFALKTKKVAKAPVIRSKAVEIFKKAHDEAETDDDDDVVDDAKELDGYRPNTLKKKQESKADEPSIEEKAKETMEKAKQMIAEAQKKQKELQQQPSTEASNEKEDGVERQAQVERRRKAAAFIGMLKKSNSSDRSSSDSEENSDHSSSESDESDNEAHPKRHFQEKSTG